MNLSVTEDSFWVFLFERESYILRRFLDLSKTVIGFCLRDFPAVGGSVFSALLND